MVAAGFITDRSVKKINKWSAAFYAILLGLVFATIPFFAYDGGFLDSFRKLLIGGFRKGDAGNTLIFISAFIICGLSAAVAFKAGLFNLGIMGQMSLSAFVAAIVANSMDPSVSSSGKNVVMIIISVLIGATMGFIPGLLKAFLRLNEAAVTLMLNWIAFFLLNYFSTVEEFANLDSVIEISAELSSAAIWWFLAIGISLCITFWLVLKFTNLGMAIKLNFASYSEASYLKTTKVPVTLGILTFSGALAGLGGFVLYSNPSYSFHFENAVYVFGFETIAAAVLAFTNPLAVILSGTILGILFGGANSSEWGNAISNLHMTLSFMFVLFGTLFLPLLVKIRITDFIRDIRLKSTNPKIKEFSTISATKIKTLKAEYIPVLRTLKLTDKLHRDEIKDLRDLERSQVDELDFKYNDLQIQIFDHDTHVIAVNDAFKKKFEEKGINKYKTERKSYRMQLYTLRLERKAFINEALNSYKKSVNKIKIELKNKLNVNKYSQDKVKTIKETARRQIAEIDKKWRRGVIW